MFRPGSLDQFGPLSETIGVKGAIALARITRNGMHLDVGRRDAVRSGLRRQRDELVAELEREPAWEGLVRRDRKGELILTPKAQSPSLSQARLRELLQVAADEVAADTGRPVRIRKTETGKMSLAADDWEELAPFHRLVAAWLELGRAAKTLQFFGSLEGSVVHPRYTAMVRTGRTSCSSPAIQNFPRKGGIRESFVPSPGHFFLTVDYSFIELRTLAAVAQARYGTSRLAEVIRAGIDPHCFTAAMFEGLELGEFLALKDRDRDRYDTLRQRAKVLNFGIPGGLGTASLVAYALAEYGITMSLGEAEEFRRRLIDEVYPELGLYLADDAMDALASNLGARVSDCWARLDRKGDRSGAVAGGIRNIVRGKAFKADGRPYDPRYVRGVWDGLIGLNRAEDLKAPLSRRVGDEALFRRLFHSGVTTLTGRIRGRVGFTQARNTPFQGLAADGAKLALFDLTRAGYRVVAFVHDEVLIELPEDADHAAEARRVESIMNRAMEVVTGDVPVAVEYALSRVWSKKSKAVFDDRGRLLPCEVPLA